MGGIPAHIQAILDAHAESIGQKRLVETIETQNRPGDVLHSLLKTRYHVTIASCKCQEWIDRMNAWTPNGCRDHLEEIVDHLFEEASTNENVSMAIRMALRVPVVGKIEGKRQLRNLIREAITMAEFAPNKDTSLDELTVRLQTPAHNWPQGWRDWPNVIEYHRQLLRKAIAEASQIAVAPRLPNPRRGVIIPAGGHCKFYDGNPSQLYFWNAFAAAWVLRWHGCTLPIQFWFLPGEIEEIEDCDIYARRVAATCHVIDVSGCRTIDGWRTKINAILQSDLDEVLHLDADNIVTKDPSFLFDTPEFQNNEALLWEDQPKTTDDFHGKVIGSQWERMGESRRDKITDLESGQMLIRKTGGGERALHVVKHLADHADYWGGFNGGEKGVWYGDKTDFHMGYVLTKTPAYIRENHSWNAGGFFAHDWTDGVVLFQHACHKKGHITNGHEIQNLQGNALIAEAARFKSPLQFMDGTVEDAIRGIAPERMFWIDMNDRLDRGVWMDVVSFNEYQLPPEFVPGAVIVDIWANSGAFSYACLRRGVKFVDAYEPTPDVAERCRMNNAFAGERFRLTNKAVWRSDIESTKIKLAVSHSLGHAGSVSAVLPPRGKVFEIDTMSLDHILREHGSVNVLKLDCEGSEYAILYTSRELHRCEHIIGEYHHNARPSVAGHEPEGGWLYAWTIDGLTKFLTDRGFEVYRYAPHARTHGGFWARKRY